MASDSCLRVGQDLHICRAEPDAQNLQNLDGTCCHAELSKAHRVITATPPEQHFQPKVHRLSSALDEPVALLALGRLEDRHSDNDRVTSPAPQLTLNRLAHRADERMAQLTDMTDERMNTNEPKSIYFVSKIWALDHKHVHCERIRKPN